MPNRYPLWKYILLITVVVLAIIYALPNAYPEDPTIEISGDDDAKVTENTQKRVEAFLAKQNVAYKEMEITENGKLLIRFADTTSQLSVAESLRELMGTSYITALNLAAATPQWLRDFDATPMNLGLDLRGGVYFLLQVDVKAALDKAMISYRDGIRGMLREERLRYTEFNVDDRTLKIQFSDEATRDAAWEQVRLEMPLVFSNESYEQGDQAMLDLTIGRDEIKSIQDFAVQQNVLTLRKRVNELGVAEPSIARQGVDRIAVQLPGVQDPTQAKEILGATATLEFRMVAEQYDAARVARSRRIPPGTELLYEGTEPVLLKKEIILSGEHIVDASSGLDPETGQPDVNITLDGQGSRIFSRVTGQNIKRLMAVVFIENKSFTYRDDAGELKRRTKTTEEVISVARIQAQLGKRFHITGLDSPQAARKLALLLRAGALAAPIEIIEERTVGPSLGQQNIDQGVNAIVLGFILVILFMIVYYRVFGVFANMALVLNLLLITAIMSLIPGATLTLPGIVGIVLTVGMAVDANVLIFERIRQELHAGSSIQASIDNGYRQALSTIADANITTLIAAIVLFVFGTGPIKGFAVTLSIGIMCSMFTAIFGTRALVNLMYGNRRLKQIAI